VFRIRIPLIRNRIRIQHFRLNSDSDPGLWLSKIGKKIPAEKKCNFFKIKNCYLPTVFLRLHKGRPSYRRSLQLSKENIKHFKIWNFLMFFYFLCHFCPSGSGSGFRIRIQRPDWIRFRIRNTW
jgi:hypothetical protein